MAFLEAIGLKKSYGPVAALAGIDLNIEAGEFVTLLGPSGSGKSTLLMAIAGFTAPDTGRVLLEGRDITRMEPEDRAFGFVFQGYALFPHLSAADNIAFPLKVRKWDRGRIAARVAEMLTLVDLGALGARKPRELSGGQQQRVALARALAFGPKILLLDEPLSALDRTLREVMQRELKRLHRETGVTFLYVTHDQEEAITMSDRIAVFDRGRIVQIGDPRSLYARPNSRFVAGFLGANNLLEATAGDDGLFVLGSHGPLPPAIGARRGPVTVHFRPEELVFAEPVGPALTFEATVIDVSFVGAFERITLRAVDGQEVTATAPPAGILVQGARVSANVPLAAIGILPADG